MGSGVRVARDLPVRAAPERVDGAVDLHGLEGVARGAHRRQVAPRARHGVEDLGKAAVRAGCEHASYEFTSSYCAIYALFSPAPLLRRRRGKGRERDGKFLRTHLSLI